MSVTILGKNQSVVYDGGGTVNALQTKTTSATLVASGANVLSMGGSTVLEVWLANSTVSQSGTLLVGEFSGDPPTVANEIRKREVAISATDQTATTDRAIWGLRTGTEYAAKNPMRIPVKAGSLVMLAVSATDGGTWYARVTARSAEDVSAELDAGDAADFSVAVTSSALPSSAATAANQAAVQANAGSDASKALAVQGVAGGKALPVIGSGTAGSAASGVVTVQGIAGGTTVPVTEASAAAMAADLNELTAGPVEKTPTFLAAVIIETPETPTVLAANNTFFRYAMLQAGRAAAANAKPISIGGNTAYTSQLQTQLAPGDTMVLEPPPGTKWDLNDFYIDGENTDDGVRIMYVAP